MQALVAPRWREKRYFLPPSRRPRKSEHYSVAIATIRIAYNLTINSNQTPRALMIERQRKS
jgi:hypothetical protein